MIWGGTYVIITEVKCTINVMCLNHPETMPPLNPQSIEKLSPAKPVPFAAVLVDIKKNSKII